VQTTTLHESFEGSNSSLAYFCGELSPVTQAASGRHAFSAVFGFLYKTGFLDHNSDSR